MRQAILFKKIFLASGISLNDPFDFAPAFVENTTLEINRFIKSAARVLPINKDKFSRISGQRLSRNEFRRRARLLQRPMERVAFEKRAARELFQEFRTHTKVACFSEVLHNSPMWAHYAGNHTGVCYEYAVDWGGGIGGEVYPLSVEYRKSRPEISTLDMMRFVSERRSGVETEDSIKIFESLCLAKSVDWGYEREWRVFLHSPNPAGYFEFLKLRVERVIFGSNADPMLIDKVADLYGDRVEVCQASISMTSFDFDVSTVRKP